MATPFVGQIISVGFNFAPEGWFLCDGTLKPVDQYTPLFQLLGSTYGGNGTTTFALPDLRGRVPLCMGQGQGLSSYLQGQPTGVEEVTLTAGNTPLHTHSISFSANNVTDAKPSTGFTVGTNIQPAISGFYAPGPANVGLRGGTITNNAGGVPHENRQPFLVLNYIIAWAGVYPSQN
jgi:microcystin-dependent protein